jgi:hypothetical protein
MNTETAGQLQAEFLRVLRIDVVNREQATKRILAADERGWHGFLKRR